MYIGRLGDGSNVDDGIYILLKEVIDNAIDEFIMGHGKRILVKIDGGLVKVRDYGRSIPLGKVVECVSVINTGAKYNDEVFQFSVGLNGVGTKAVNALSEKFRVVSFRRGQYFEAIFERGRKVKERKGKKEGECDETYVELVPDPEIFGEYAYNMEFVEQRLWNYACLNAELSLKLGAKPSYSEGGLLGLLDGEIGDEKLYTLGHYRADRLEFSFVNGQFTSDGGTHLSAFREGILKGVNEYLGKNFSGMDVREGIFCLPHPHVHCLRHFGILKRVIEYHGFRPFLGKRVGHSVPEIPVRRLVRPQTEHPAGE